MCSNKGCNNSSCNGNCSNTCDPCNEQPCGCAFEVDAACVRYTGNELPCIDVIPGETLEQALESINDKMCDLYPAVDGEDGDSAYQIWLNLGNTGTEQDFIDSLTGPAGPAGPQGPIGPQGLPGQDCECPVNVFYSENILGPGSTGLFDDPVIVPSTTYTVPTGGAGVYRILYTAESVIADLPGGIAEIFVKLLVNGTPHPIYRQTRINSGDAGFQSREGIALNYQLTLAAGDVVQFEGTATTPEVQYLAMGIMIIDKVPTP